MDHEERGQDSENHGPPDKPCWLVILTGQIHKRLEERCAKNKKESAQDKLARQSTSATRWIAFFTFFTIVISGLQWRTLDKTDETLRTTLDAAQNNQKPILSFSISLQQISSPDDPTPIDIPEGVIPEYAVLRLTFRNHGQMPAIIRGIAIDKLIADHLPAKPTYPPRVVTTPPRTLLLRDGEPITVQPDSFVIKLNERERSDIRDGKTLLWIFGRLYFGNFQGESGVGSDSPPYYLFAKKYLFKRTSPRGHHGFVHDESIPSAYVEQNENPPQ